MPNTQNPFAHSKSALSWCFNFGFHCYLETPQNMQLVVDDIKIQTYHLKVYQLQYNTKGVLTFDASSVASPP